MRRIRITVCLAALLALLTVPALAHAEASRTITGFPGTQQALQMLEGSVGTEGDLLAQMPETLEVYLDGGREVTAIPVTWACAEANHLEENHYHCQYVPRWDETRYRLAEGLDLLADVPYVSVRWHEGEVTLESVTGVANERTIYRYLKNELGLNTAAACGVLVNIYSESSFKPTNLQNTYEKTLGHTDESYTEAVDDGTYTNFVHDAAGYGLCQWTFWSRKEALLNYAREKGTSIGDLEMQLNYMFQEMGTRGRNYLQSVENTAAGACDAAHYFCAVYEKPANYENRAVIRGNLARDTYWPEYQPEVTVKLDAQGGEVHPGRMELPCGEPYGAFPVPARDGYTFLGWAAEPKGTVFLTEETLLTTEEDHTFYAVWKEGVAVTLDACGGDVAPKELWVFLGQPYGQLPVPIREGKWFLGWGETPDAETFLTAESEVRAVDAHTLYAVWSDEPPHTHTLLHSGAMSASCTEPGRLEFWHCSGCGGTYADAEAAAEMDWAETFLNPAGHCWVEGICSVCGAAESLSLRSGGIRMEENCLSVTACLANPGGEAVRGTLWAALYRSGRFEACALAAVTAEAGAETRQELSLPVRDAAEGAAVSLFFLREDGVPLTNSASAWAGALEESPENR